MLGLLLALSLLLLLWLLQAPHWFRAALFALSLLATGTFTVLAGGELAVAPLLVLAMSVALLLPGRATSRRRTKIAPAKGTLLESRRRRRRVSELGREGVDIPGYEILEKVGSGGMATVYRARKSPGGRIVALKVPMEQYSADDRLIRRFHREAEVAQRLAHPNIVRTFEHGTAGSRHYMVMEFVEGKSLEELIEEDSLDFESSVEIMKRVADALRHIHSAGIIHRDIKPANIMITAGGLRQDGERLAPESVKLMDFGIAGGKVLTRLTATGARIGTPVYMSPEQARGDRIDHRGDIYSLGLVFYEMLTGQTAFRGGYDAVVHQQIFQDPPPPRQLRPEVPRSLEELVMRMIAKDPSERPALDEVQSTLSDPEVLSAPEPVAGDRILLSAGASKGAVRTLDLEGRFLESIADLGAEPPELPASPLALTAAAGGVIYAAVLEYRLDRTTGTTILRSVTEDGRLSFQAVPAEDWPPQPLSLATSPDGEVLYVLDGTGPTVYAFDGSGRCLHRFGSPGREKGGFDDPRVIATGPGGEIYVLDFGNRRVQRFDPQGNFRGQLSMKPGEGGEPRVLDGMAVGSDGCVYLADRAALKVRRFAPDGRPSATFQLEETQAGGEDDSPAQLLDLAIDSDGCLYTARRGGRRIEKFAPEGGRATSVLDVFVPIVQMTVVRS